MFDITIKVPVRYRMVLYRTDVSTVRYGAVPVRYSEMDRIKWLKKVYIESVPIVLTLGEDGSRRLTWAE
jgi:hypothetical protein